MAGKVIALIQEKGGSKKTTNCVNIAGCLISMGYKVALVEILKNFLRSMRKIQPKNL
jgi:cellulose biosynthesis protein BcsQ